jgi:hypothetical protein
LEEVIPILVYWRSMMKFGPINSFNGFPLWYKDENGVRLQQGLDPNDPFSGLTTADLPNPSQPVSFPNNYPEEAFYFSAEAEMTTGTGERARLVLALEAAFGGGVPKEGDQMVFGRVRIRVSGLQPNEEYFVSHPYGNDSFIAEPDPGNPGFGEINFTEDIGGVNKEGFELALSSRVHPFLKWDPTIGPDAPVGYVGDPNVAHPIIGSVVVDRFGQPQNFFRIEGPGIGVGSPDRSNTSGINPDNCIETVNYYVLGKFSTVSGVDVTRANYTQNVSSSGIIDVFASSDDGIQDIEVSGTGINSTKLQGENGKYFSRIGYSGANPPFTITVTNISDTPQSEKVVVPTDFISAVASYDTDLRILTIEASSTDIFRVPILTVTDFGEGTLPIPSTGLLAINLAYTPDKVTISSTSGGQRTIPVTVTGSTDAPIPVAANAGEDLTVIFGSEVTLIGTNSTGPITGFSWSQISGTAIALAGANTANPTFTAPATPSTLIFELTVNGPGGPSTDQVTVEVVQFSPVPIANAGPDQTVQQGTLVVLSGSATGVISSYQWQQISGTFVQLNNANTANATFTFPKQAGPLRFQLTVNGPGGTSSDDVQVSTVVDTLTVTKAEYRTRVAEWRVSGTTDVFGPGVMITIFIGNTLGGNILAQVEVDALGEWEFRVKNFNVQPDGTRSLSIQSSSGGTLINVPINIRQ